MNYFSKIEAYFSGELSAVERGLFEEELAMNAALQKGVEAYELAQDLFDFTAEHLSEETIIASEANETAAVLIDFVANNLSENQILETTSIIEKQAITRTLLTRRHRRAWLVAASMLLILSLMGTRFYLTQEKQEGNIQVAIAKKATEGSATIEPDFPIEKTIRPTPEKEAIVAKEKIKTTKIKPVNEPIKDKEIITIPQNIVLNTEKEEKITLPKRPIIKIVEPLVTNITAQEISTGKVIDRAESAIYSGTNAVILKAGFHAKAGANFTATATDILNHSVSTVIEHGQPVVYSARETITLEAGFYAKPGADFTAKTKEAVNDISIGAIISPEERVVFKAGNTITFKPGFHAKLGATLVATVGD